MKLTDEIVRDFLRYLYDSGYRYLFIDKVHSAIAVSKSKPTFSDNRCIESMNFYDELFGYERKLGKAILNDEGYCIDIGKKINIFDWSTVKVDTKIHVKDRKKTMLGCDVISLIIKMAKYMFGATEKLHGVRMAIVV